MIPCQDPTDLRSMVEPVAPPPVPMGPDTPSAWLAIALLVAGMLTISWWLFRRWRAEAYRRAALRELDRVGLRAADRGQRAAALIELNALLKRTALAAWPRASVAALSGEPWLRFLASTGAPRVERRSLAPLNEVVYRSSAAANLDDAATRAVLAAARAWVRHHDREATPC